MGWNESRFLMSRDNTFLCKNHEWPQDGVNHPGVESASQATRIIDGNKIIAVASNINAHRNAAQMTRTRHVQMKQKKYGHEQQIFNYRPV